MTSNLRLAHDRCWRAATAAARSAQQVERWRNVGRTESTSRVGSHADAVLGASHIGRHAIGDGSTGMMSGPHVDAILAATRRPLRLKLKPKAPITGYVDGAWWPRSRDLAAELPALVEVLAVRLGSVTRVAYALTAWDTAPRRAEVDGRTVRLEGFGSQDEHVVDVIGAARQRLSLLVVPPEATDAASHDAMMTAAGRDNAERPAKILTSSGVLPAEPIPAPRPAHDDGQDRWEVDGGRVYERA